MLLDHEKQALDDNSVDFSVAISIPDADAYQNSPGHLIEEEKAYLKTKFIGGKKKIEDINAVGVGVGMTKAFG